jgi:two-component system chemotaxis response regulator CheB
MIDDDDRLSRVIEQDFGEQAGDERSQQLTMYTCPDCGGALWQAESGSHGRFRCHVGHAYTPEVLLGQKSEELEAALWSCVRLLREKATLTRQTAVRSRAGGQHDWATRGEESAQLSEDQARVIRELLEAMPSLADRVPAQPAAIGASEPAASE